MANSVASEPMAIIPVLGGRVVLKRRNSLKVSPGVENKTPLPRELPSRSNISTICSRLGEV